MALYDDGVTQMLELAADLPVVDLVAGDTLVEEGRTTGAVWVLESGTLAVTKAGQRVNVIDQPGSIIGEVSVILGSGATASVVAASPCRVRHAVDGEAFLHRDASIAIHVAQGLARRLDLVTTYLADLKRQYTGTPGLDMVDEVLGRLATASGPPARPGSARDPDPEY